LKEKDPNNKVIGLAKRGNGSSLPAREKCPAPFIQHFIEGKGNAPEKL
jgi:hypothetical protein